MFGQMMVEPVVQIDPGVDLQTAVAALLKAAENVEIVRWIELPASVCCSCSCPEIQILGRSMSSTGRKEPGTPWISRTNNSADTA